MLPTDFKYIQPPRKRSLFRRVCNALVWVCAALSVFFWAWFIALVIASFAS